MSKPVVLVTGTAISEQASKPLREAGFEVVMMKMPVDEPALLKAVADHALTSVE